jgi:hypothetical protein
MNIDELAKESGLQLNVYAEAYPVIAQQLERFAELVREEERRRIAQRVADTTISFNIKVNQLGWEETRTLSVSLADLKQLIEEDK